MPNQGSPVLVAVLLLETLSISSGLCRMGGPNPLQNPEKPQVIQGEGPAGVGMEINQDRAGHYVVMKLEPNGPAEKKKVSIGDRLIAVNRHPVDGLTMSETVKLIRGESNTSVRLNLQTGKRNRTITIKRRNLAPSNQPGSDQSQSRDDGKPVHE